MPVYLQPRSGQILDRDHGGKPGPAPLLTGSSSDSVVLIVSDRRVYPEDVRHSQRVQQQHLLPEHISFSEFLRIHGSLLLTMLCSIACSPSILRSLGCFRRISCDTTRHHLMGTMSRMDATAALDTPRVRKGLDTVFNVGCGSDCQLSL